MALGALLQGLLISGLPWRVAKKLGEKRSALEDWALKEHDSAITDEMFRVMYYGGNASAFATQETKLNAISQARALVMTGYGECKPRRELIAVLDATAEAVKTSEVQSLQGDPARIAVGA
jgi:hypothetical protein